MKNIYCDNCTIYNRYNNVKFFFYKRFHFLLLSHFSCRFNCPRSRDACRNGGTWWHGYHDTRTDESYAANDAATLSVIYSGAWLGPHNASTNANNLPLKSNIIQSNHTFRQGCKFFFVITKHLIMSNDITSLYTLYLTIEHANTEK